MAKEEPSAYVLHVFDQYGNPVPDMIVNFCTDQACAQTQSDENGIISFDGAEDNYHIQLLKAPEGYRLSRSVESRSRRLQTLLPPTVHDELKAWAKKEKVSVNVCPGCGGATTVLCPVCMGRRAAPCRKCNGVGSRKKGY